jgi:uncharacterized protein YkvS
MTSKPEGQKTMGQKPMSLTSHTRPSSIRLATGYQQQRKEQSESVGHKRPMTPMSDKPNSVDDPEPVKKQLRQSHQNIRKMIEVTDKVKGMVNSINENIIITKMDFIHELELKSDNSSSSSVEHKAVLSSINQKVTEINEALKFLGKFLSDNKENPLGADICFGEEFVHMEQDIKSIQDTLDKLKEPTSMKDASSLKGINELKGMIEELSESLHFDQISKCLIDEKEQVSEVWKLVNVEECLENLQTIIEVHKVNMERMRRDLKNRMRVESENVMDEIGELANGLDKMCMSEFGKVK